jgi:hypothetical protein
MLFSQIARQIGRIGFVECGQPRLAVNTSAPLATPYSIPSHTVCSPAKSHHEFFHVFFPFNIEYSSSNNV